MMDQVARCSLTPGIQSPSENIENGFMEPKYLTFRFGDWGDPPQSNPGSIGLTFNQPNQNKTISQTVVP